LTSFEIGVHIPMPFLMIVPLANNAVESRLRVVATRKCRINCNEILSPPID